MRRSDRPALVRITGLLFVVAITGGVVAASVHTPWLAVSQFAHGIVLVHLFSLQHECTHYSAFRTRWLNSAVASVCGWLLTIPPLHFRYEHTDHHTYTQNVGRDPELIPIPGSLWGYLSYLSALPYWYAAITGIVRRSFGHLTDAERSFIPQVERARVIAESRAMLLFYVTVGTVVLLGWRAPLTYWLVPVLLGQPVMRFIRMTEHVGCALNTEVTLNTRSMRAIAPLRFLCWNMNYHAEHHLAPSVPFHALPQMHKMLEGKLTVARSYFAVHRDILREVRKGAAQVEYPK